MSSASASQLSSSKRRGIVEDVDNDTYTIVHVPHSISPRKVYSSSLPQRPSTTPRTLDPFETSSLERCFLWSLETFKEALDDVSFNDRVDVTCEEYQLLLNQQAISAPDACCTDIVLRKHPFLRGGEKVISSYSAKLALYAATLIKRVAVTVSLAEIDVLSPPYKLQLDIPGDVVISVLKLCLNVSFVTAFVKDGFQ